MKIKVLKSEAGERIDKFLTKEIPQYSRNYFLKLIKGEKILVNGQAIKASYILKHDDRISIDLAEEKIMGILPEKIDLDIIFEDDNVLVINKQPGIVVHPAAGHTSGTLVNAILDQFPEIKKAVYDEKSEISRIRPGLVHRLDKDTSGVMIVAKNSQSMKFLSDQIQNRRTQKIYWALCSGWPKDETGHLIGYLGRHPKNRKLITDIGKENGKEAISDYKVLRYLVDKEGNKFSLIEFDIKTGRTHQIRVQVSKLGHPVLGDTFYGSKTSMRLSHLLGVQRQMLHAKSLSIALPGETGPTLFQAPVPQDFSLVLEKLVDF